MLETRSNLISITVRIWLILAGVPLCSLLGALTLRLKTNSEPDAGRRQYQELGYNLQILIFAAWLAVLLLSGLRGQAHQGSPLLLMVLPALGVVASLASAVLLVLNCRSWQRPLALLISALALAYSGLTLAALLAGGGGY